MLVCCYSSPIKMAHELQLALPARPTWGGRRAGAGRKRAPGRRPSVPHHARPPHAAAHPAHVTLRTGVAVRCLRSARAFPAVARALSASSTGEFRILHYSAQDDHLHLIVEAADARTLSSGVRGLTIRVARAVNRALGRRGPVWSGRHHARPLTTPREGPSRARVRPHESSQTRWRRPRNRPVFLGAVVRWMARLTAHRAIGCAGRPSAHVARGRGLAPARTPRARRTPEHRPT